MKVLQNGKEVKNANVSYFAGGHPAHVEIDGVNYDPSAFEFVDEKSVKKTKPADTKTKQTKATKAPKKGLKSKLSSVLSTKDV